MPQKSTGKNKYQKKHTSDAKSAYVEMILNTTSHASILIFTMAQNDLH